MLTRIRAFLNGMAEVRHDVTTNYDDQGIDVQDAYERGRVFAARFVRRSILRHGMEE